MLNFQQNSFDFFEELLVGPLSLLISLYETSTEWYLFFASIPTIILCFNKQFFSKFAKFQSISHRWLLSSISKLGVEKDFWFSLLVMNKEVSSRLVHDNLIGAVIHHDHFTKRKIETRLCD